MAMLLPDQRAASGDSPDDYCERRPGRIRLGKCFRPLRERGGEAPQGSLSLAPSPRTLPFFQAAGEEKERGEKTCYCLPEYLFRG